MVTNHDVPERSQAAAVHLSQESLGRKRSGAKNRCLLTFGYSEIGGAGLICDYCTRLSYHT